MAGCWQSYFPTSEAWLGDPAPRPRFQPRASARARPVRVRVRFRARASIRGPRFKHRVGVVGAPRDKPGQTRSDRGFLYPSPPSLRLSQATDGHWGHVCSQADISMNCPSPVKVTSLIPPLPMAEDPRPPVLGPGVKQSQPPPSAGLSFPTDTRQPFSGSIHTTPPPPPSRGAWAPQPLLFLIPAPPTPPDSPLREVQTLPHFPQTSLQPLCTHGGGSPWQLLPLPLGPQQDPDLALRSSLGVRSRVYLPGHCPLAVYGVGRASRKSRRSRAPHLLRPAAFVPVLGRVNFAGFFEPGLPAVTCSSLLSWSGSSPERLRGPSVEGWRGEGTIAACSSTSPYTPSSWHSAPLPSQGLPMQMGFRKPRPQVGAKFQHQLFMRRDGGGVEGGCTRPGSPRSLPSGAETCRVSMATLAQQPHSCACGKVLTLTQIPSAAEQTLASSCLLGAQARLEQDRTVPTPAG